MAKNEERQTKESPIEAFCINEGNKTVLITPYGEYHFAAWGLVNVTPVENYSDRVKKELLAIATQVGVAGGAGIYHDRDIKIQIKFGAKPVKTA